MNIKMKISFIIFLVLFISLNVFAHPWKPAHYVIIDTDGGVDDIRAINYLLASPNVRVLAITTSSGALSAENSYLKVKSLLNACFHEGLPVGINRKSGFISSEFSVALKTKWGDETGVDSDKAPDAIELIRKILSVEKTKISFICLGGMSTISSSIIKIPDFKTQVKDILWSADGLNDTKGFNFNCDKNASLQVLNGEIPLKIIRNTGTKDFYNNDFVKKIGLINTIYSKKISESLTSEIAKSHNFIFQGIDDMVPLYLHFPELFKAVINGKNSDCIPENIPLLQGKALVILNGETISRNQVVKSFPADSSFYFSDVQKDVSGIIDRYGIDEWTSGVIANELHRHLGVYAIIGVKMGIRAREYFATGVDEFRATTYAGSTPPLSCMNDGVQVSTGATPGHGLLTVRSDTITRPVAEFSYLNHKIRLTLKSEIADKINRELKEISFVNGLDSNIYWELVRKNSIKYWRDLDRHDIFIIEAIN
jgi:pyrimidine-specific ribonucleoside hydrolase